MQTDDGTPLTPAERRALHDLPHEAESPPELEDKVVAVLRARRLVGPSAGLARRLRRVTVAAAIAAGAALFLAGMAVGQRLDRPVRPEAAAQARQQGAYEAALAVQRAGTVWVTALAMLAELDDTTAAGAVGQGRETARGALAAAARALVLLAPGDSTAGEIVRLLARQPEGVRGEPVFRRTVSF